MPIKKEIMYPIFLECLKYTSDTFWENIFEDLAHGKTPYGTYINKNFLCCSYKNKEFSYKIENKDPENLYNDVVFLFNKKLGILSMKDKINKKIDFENVEKDIQCDKNSWNNIRKKNIKDLLIESFVLEMKKEYSLDYKKAKKLLSYIYIAMIFKIISMKDVNYDNGKILSINGISFSQNDFTFENNIYDLDTDYRKCIFIDKYLMSDNWDKYLNNLQKLNDLYQ